jgi:hypothetical protein
MALVSELNAATAAALTYPLPTVAMFSRVLREAGLISKKGRGRGAAHATPIDGARMLIALLTTPTPFAGGRMAQAVDCVTDFGGLVQDEGYNAELVHGVPNSGFTLAAAYGLPKRHTFEQAVAAILAGFAEDRFAECFKAATSPRIEVMVLDWALGATIRMGPNVYHYTFAGLVDANTERDKLARAADDYAKVVSKYKRGIKSRRIVETGVLSDIATVINGPREPARPSSGVIK